MKTVRFLPLCTGLFLLLIFSTESPAVTVFKTLSFASRDSVWVKNFRLFTEKVEKESGGNIRFNYVGGPEAIPPFEQIEALKRGVIDVALIPGAYFVPQMPEADAMKLSEYLPWEEREKGIYKFYNTLMQEKLGVFYLGKVAGGIRYRFYLKKPIEKPSLSGLKIRVTPIYEPFVRALSGIPVTMAPGEVYIAIERGVVDGFGWPSIGVTDLGWQEVVKYTIEPGFYQTDVCILINLKVWDRLEEKTKKTLTGIIEKVEKESYYFSQKTAEKERELLISKGLNIIEFKEDEAELYLSKAYASGWERVIKKSPVNGKILKEMLKR